MKVIGGDVLKQVKSEFDRACPDIPCARATCQRVIDTYNGTPCDEIVVAIALKSRLQAEAPTDAEVAEIEKRHRERQQSYDYAKEASGEPLSACGPLYHQDIATLLTKLRARTSQAEAQAPTTAASVLTDVDALARECFKEFAVFQGRPTTFDDMEERHKETWRDNARNIIDRLTVGAPAPAPTPALLNPRLQFVPTEGDTP